MGKGTPCPLTSGLTVALRFEIMKKDLGLLAAAARACGYPSGSCLSYSLSGLKPFQARPGQTSFKIEEERWQKMGQAKASHAKTTLSVNGRGIATTHSFH